MNMRGKMQAEQHKDAFEIFIKLYEKYPLNTEENLDRLLYVLVYAIMIAVREGVKPGHYQDWVKSIVNDLQRFTKRSDHPNE